MMRARTRAWIPVSLAVATWAVLVAARLEVERQAGSLKGGLEGAVIGSHYDPRGKDRVRVLAERRESDSFRERLRSWGSTGWEWPGLRAAQVSWNWLEVLQGLHTESSFEGDFSWLFSKLDRILRSSHKNEYMFVSRISPFFFVIGKDGAGTTYVMNELLDRARHDGKVWFWSAYHAMENLSQQQLAADLYLRASQLPDGPRTAAPLALRLRYGSRWLDPNERKRILQNELNPDLAALIRGIRPELFAEEPASK